MKTVDYLDAIKRRYDVSDYKAAELLDLTRSSISRWRTGHSSADYATGLKFAELLGLDPAVVLADLQIEQMKDSKVRAVFQRIADMTRKSAAVIMLNICALGFFAAPSDGYARNLASGADSLCIMSNRLRRLFGSVLRLLLSGNNKKGLFNERTLSHSRLGRLPRARRLYLYARRPRAAQKPIGNLLLSARTALLRAAGIGIIAAAGHATFIAPAHADGITIGFKSIHHGPGDYYERNTGLCYETGFQYFVTGCAYIDSHQEPAAILAAGVRLTVSEHVHIGGVFGLRFREELNEYGQMVIDPDPMLAAIVTLGTDRHAAQVVHVPELPDAPAVSWLQYRYGY